jgi:hypothetical protein
MSCLCTLDEAAFFRWVVYHCWLMIHQRCTFWIDSSWVFIATFWMVTNWSSFEVAFVIDKSMCKQTLISWLEWKWLDVLEYIWNICVNLHFSSVGSWNQQHFNEPLVGAKIWTSNLPDCKRVFAQLINAAPLILWAIVS